VQVDEPSLPAVLAGRIGTASGLSSFRAVDVQVAERELGRVFAAADDAGAIAGVHCCASDAPVDLLRAAGAQLVSLDFTRLEDDPIHDDALGRAWESGMGILAGCIPPMSNEAIGDARASAPLRNVLHRIGFDDPVWLEQVAITPACGLAGASPSWAIAALRACAAVGRVVKNEDREDEEPEDRRKGRR
ncbi:MAG: methionine synthase, partial [bacterium]|nr:methionine synthase [bacterium]